MGTAALLACAAPAARVETIVLIVIDTVRQDRMSVYGHSVPTTPNLERFAEHAVKYTRAYSQAPWTTPSIGSLLTSQYPSSLGIKEARSPLPEDVVLLPEVLQSAGFRTAGVVSHSFCSQRWGFGRGFDVFDESNIATYDRVTGLGVSARALEILDESRGEPLFLLLHYFDPHIAYIEHEGFSSQWKAPPYAGPIRSGMLQRELRPMRDELGPRDIEELGRIYDSEIALTDSLIGDVLRRLRELGRFDDALIAITADHGEEFLDHGDIGHAKSLYDELVLVPLLVKFPDGVSGVVDQPIALLDVFPTILDVAGLQPPQGLRGRSLPRPGEEAPGEHPVFMETSRGGNLRGIVMGRHKLIRDLESGQSQLYDLVDDPRERRDLVSEEPETANALLGKLEAWMRRNPARQRGPSALELSDEEKRRLRDLGYL